MMTIAVVGHLASGKKLLNGQTIKTKIIVEGLIAQLGKDNVYTVDSHNWSKNPVNLIIQCIKAFKKCEFIIFMPAHNGVKVFVHFFTLLNLLFKRKLIYIVIGGWLPSLIESKKILRKKLQNITKIYVETETMKSQLNKMDFKNVTILPNCKDLDIVDVNTMECKHLYPFRICTFSRVMKEKGIEDVINSVKYINKTNDKIIYTLDIYGQVDPAYVKEFDYLMQTCPDFIRYKGEIDYDKSVSVLKDYFFLVFPTKFYTEGIPGTIIDAYASGLPVIASMWESYSDIIDDGKTGLVYEFNSNDELTRLLTMIKDKPCMITDMKTNCVKKASSFSSKEVINTLVNDLFKEK